jgi:hypothetical protein
VAQLGEVLGGMLTDVIRARMAADSLTAQAVETYRANPTLASMSVPRVTIADVTVKLNFAVSQVDVPTPRPVETELATADWNIVVRDRILPFVPRAPRPAPAPPAPSPAPSPRRPPLSARAVRPPLGETEIPRIEVPVDVVSGSLAGDVDPLVDNTLSTIVEGAGVTLDADQRRLLTERIRREATTFTGLLRQRQLADQALRSRLEIDVVSDRVSTTKPEALQSLEITLSLSDVEEILAFPVEGG